MQAFDREIDVRGPGCPLPILDARKVPGELSPIASELTFSMKKR